MNAKDHHKAVDAFFAACREQDQRAYDELCARTPTLTRHKYRRIWRTERTVGLLGLEPAHIAPAVAQKYGYESVFNDDA